MTVLKKVIVGLTAYSPLARDGDSVEQSRKDVATVRRRERAKLSRRGLALPYTAYPLPQAGDSLADKLTRTVQNKVLFWWLLLGLLVLLQSDRLLLLSDTAFVIALAVILLIAIWQTCYWSPKIRKMRQGVHGERLVAEFLNNTFRDEIKGIVRIYHDIPCGTGNYDHVIICRKGVFLINTKAMAIRTRGENILQYRNHKLYFKNTGKPLTYDPVSQMKHELVRFRQLLEEAGCENPDLTGVVFFPGWEVEEHRPYSPVWVMSPKDLPKRINELEDRLPDEDVKKYAKKISLWMRYYLDPSV